MLLILALLAEVLAPILERYGTSQEQPAERLLGNVAGVEVVAVRGDGRSVQIEGRSVSVDPGESIVLRPETPSG